MIAYIFGENELKKRLILFLLLFLLSSCTMKSNLNIKSGGDQIYYISKQNESINIEILNIETREKNKLIIDEVPLE